VGAASSTGPPATPAPTFPTLINSGVLNTQPKTKTHFCIARQACHLSGVEQMLLPISMTHCRGVELSASYKNAQENPDSKTSLDYFDALAMGLLTCAAAIPNGLLVFFKSYSLLGMCKERLEHRRHPTDGKPWIDHLRACKGYVTFEEKGFFRRR